MHDQKQTDENTSCCCCSLRTGCITAAVFEIMLIPCQLIYITFVSEVPSLDLLYAGLVIGVFIAALIIYGVIKQNRWFLWPCVLLNIVTVCAIPVLYYVIEVRGTPDAQGIAAIWIYSALLIVITVVQILLTLVVCRHIWRISAKSHTTKRHRYDKVGSTGEADDFMPLPV